MNVSLIRWIANGALLGTVGSWFITDMTGGRSLLGTLLCLAVACGLHWGASIGESCGPRRR